MQLLVDVCRLIDCAHYFTCDGAWCCQGRVYSRIYETWFKCVFLNQCGMCVF